jgi:hypothetical protein
MMPPEVFANATIAFKTPSGEERSRLNFQGLAFVSGKKRR